MESSNMCRLDTVPRKKTNSKKTMQPQDQGREWHGHGISKVEFLLSPGKAQELNPRRGSPGNRPLVPGGRGT